MDEIKTFEYLYFKFGRCSLINGRFFWGVTSVIGNSLSTPEGLRRWQANLGWENSEYEKSKSAEFGTDVHNKLETIGNLLIAANQEVLWNKYDFGDKNIIRDFLNYTYNKVGKFTDVLKDKMVYAWMEFVEMERVFFLGTEMKLLSNKHRYAGTADAKVLMYYKTDLERRAILDYKTSNRLRSSYIPQLSAYKQTCIESGEEKEKELDTYLLRFKKGEFDGKPYELKKTEYRFDIFLSMLTTVKWYVVEEYNFNPEIANKGW